MLIGSAGAVEIDPSEKPLLELRFPLNENDNERDGAYEDVVYRVMKSGIGCSILESGSRFKGIETGKRTNREKFWLDSSELDRAVSVARSLPFTKEKLRRSDQIIVEGAAIEGGRKIMARNAFDTQLHGLLILLGGEVRDDVRKSYNRAETKDHRINRTTGVAIPWAPRDEIEILDLIFRSRDEELVKAFKHPLTGHLLSLFSYRLKWSKRLALKDGDYVLCLFDSANRIYPGDNPRILILFSLDYGIKAWGSFLCEPPFDYGTIVQSPFSSDQSTYFVTVNPSPRSGGQLWFEKYRITPTKIEKLGEGPELLKIPENP